VIRFIIYFTTLFIAVANAQQPNGTINSPIYATGYISQVGGTIVTTKILAQPNHPTNLNIYTTGAISGTWNIQMPNPAFEGQILSFSCGGSAASILITSSDGSAIDSNLPASCVSASTFAAQFDQRSNIWRYIGYSNSASISPGQLPAFIGGDCTTSVGSVVLNCAFDSTKLTGGILPSVASISALKALTISAGKRVQTDGYYVAGDGGANSFYAATGAGAGTYVDDGGCVILPTGGDGSAAWLCINLNQVSIKQYGAKADGVMTLNYGTGVTTISGTDNATRIQSAINYALRNARPRVFVDDGTYRTTDTLQLNWGDAYRNIELIGGGRAAYSGVTGGPGILCDMIDRPCIAVNAGRNVRIAGFAMRGYNTAFGYNTANTSTPTTQALWLLPALAKSGVNPGGLQQRAPAAGIAIDPYKGTAPAAPYPNKTLPAWTGLATQYGWLASGQTEIANMEISGFPVAIVGSPNGDGGGGGDYTNVHDSSITYSPVGIAIGNNQSRSVRLDNIAFDGLHTWIDGLTFGDQAGQYDGPISNMSGGQSYQMINIGLNYSGPFTIRNMYAESSARIGNITAGGSFPNTLIFDSCLFNLNNKGLNDNILLPSTYLGIVGNATVKFIGGNIPAGPRIANLTGSSASEIIFDGTTFTGYPNDYTGASGSLAMARAFNYTGGLSVGNGSPRPPYGGFMPRVSALASVRGTYLDTSTFAITDQVMASDEQFIGNHSPRAPLTQFTTGIVDTQKRRWSLDQLAPVLLIDFTSATYAPVAPSFANDIVTWTYAAPASSPGAQMLLFPGSIIHHNNSGTLFVVTAVGAPTGLNYPITMRQMNNMLIHTDGTFKTQLLGDLTLAGYSTVTNTHIDLPAQVEFGTWTSGSATVASVHRGDGYGGDISTYLKTTDDLYPLQFPDAYFAWPATNDRSGSMTAITPGSPGSITLHSNSTFTGRAPIYPLPIH
jgi:hypothetical protein